MKEKILKTLIILGIIAIIISLYAQYGKPYLKELALERQDQIRIKDLDNLNKVLSNLVSTSSTQFIGKKNTIYISIPSDNPTCTDVDLPSVPDGWNYHCSATSTLTHIDGTGWLPVSFTDSTSTITNLPIDPINNAGTLNYYAYVASSTNQYVVTGVLDSKKYLKEKGQDDGGIDNIRYEVGNNLKLWSHAYGLVGYWRLNATKGVIVSDSTENNIDGNVVGEIGWTGKGFKFTGQNYLIFNNKDSIDKLGESGTSYTILFLIKNPGTKNQSIAEKWKNSITYPWAIRIDSNNIVFADYDGRQWKNVVADEKIILDGNWHSLVAIKNTPSSSLEIYIDGFLKKSAVDNSTGIDISNKDPFVIGNRNEDGGHAFLGQLSDFMMFKRNLNAKEIEKVTDALIDTKE